MKLTHQPLRITDESRCDACGRFLQELPLARFPNGTVVHAKCVEDRRVDPVTGRRFDSW